MGILSKHLTAAFAASLLAASAFAQVPDALKIETTQSDTHVTVISAGKTIEIARSNEASLIGSLVDLDGDGVLDVALKYLFDDGIHLEFMLRRGERFVPAGAADAISPDTVLLDIDGDGAVEVMSPPPHSRALFEVLADNEVQVLRFKNGKFVQARIECEPALRSAYIAAAGEAEAHIAQFGADLGVLYGYEIDKSELALRSRRLAELRARLAAGCPAR